MLRAVVVCWLNHRSILFSHYWYNGTCIYFVLLIQKLVKYRFRYSRTAAAVRACTMVNLGYYSVQFVYVQDGGREESVYAITLRSGGVQDVEPAVFAAVPFHVGPEVEAHALPFAPNLHPDRVFGQPHLVRDNLKLCTCLLVRLR